MKANPLMLVEVGPQGGEEIVEDFQSIPPQQVLRVHLLVRPEVGLIRVAVAYPAVAQGVSAFARLLASSERLESRDGVRHYTGSVENILGHRGCLYPTHYPLLLKCFADLAPGAGAAGEDCSELAPVRHAVSRWCTVK
eukprot:COSAG05_NODE_5176_length_1244_cov_4.354585_1_plen_138_part_00